jgi:SAM-dependent methyltransferase
MRGCPSCGELTALSGIANVAVTRPSGQPGDCVIRVLVCDQCGLGFSDDGVTQSQLDEYYAKLAKYGDLSLYSKDDAADSSLESEAPWEFERADALAGFVAQVASPDARVYDVGCSTGTLMELLRRRGFARVRGCDPLESAVVVARDHRGLDVEQGWVGSLDASQEIDVIVLSHVLEHVLELRSAVEQLRDRLASGGRVVVEVPDASRFADYVHAPYQDFNTEHVNHFSPASLSYLLQQFGFEEEQLEQVIIGSGPAHPYPAIRGCWRLVGGNAVPKPSGDSIRAHREALSRYAVISEEMFCEIDRQIIASVGDEAFALWGAGQLAMKILSRSAFPLAQLEFIVDAAPTRQGQKLDALEVFAPAAVAEDAWPPKIVAGSIFAEASIEKSVRALGIEADVIALVPAD